MARLVILVVALLALFSCRGGKNYEDAYVIREQGLLFLKITGKRPINSHNPGDVIAEKTYNDSLLIPIATLKDGVIRGEDIPVKEGYYKYKGQVIIENEKLEVNLFHNNYDDKKLEPSTWNGKYNLLIRDNE